MRLFVAALIAGAAVSACASPPVPPAGPMPTVTTTVVGPPHQPYRTCDEALKAWREGRIRCDSLIDGAVLIVNRAGGTEFCDVIPTDLEVFMGDHEWPDEAVLATDDDTGDALAATGYVYDDPVTDPAWRRIGPHDHDPAAFPDGWGEQPTPRDQAAIDAGNA